LSEVPNVFAILNIDSFRMNVNFCMSSSILVASARCSTLKFTVVLELDGLNFSRTFQNESRNDLTEARASS